MLSLIETIIGFSVIMLLLSYLVKSLTSVVKNHIDYYGSNLESELGRLVGEILNKSWKTVKQENGWLENVQWQRLREEFLSTDNIKWLLNKLNVAEGKLEELGDKLQARLEVHKANLRFVFEKRTKNLSLALGLALCLFLNINAFTIWDTLYNDQLVRAKFASPEYVASAEKLLQDYTSEIQDIESQIAGEATQSGDDVTQETEKSETSAERRDELNKQREALAKQISHFRGEVSFGIGRIWSGKVTSASLFLYEFFGSLLTGILVSIGAPYWHDLLRTISSWRKR
jgi:uncharacterized FlaG/YvyC family protein